MFAVHCLWGEGIEYTLVHVSHSTFNVAVPSMITANVRASLFGKMIKSSQPVLTQQ